MKLYSLVLVPFLAATNFLELKYSALPRNVVYLDKVIIIEVDRSASPLLYKLDDKSKYPRIIVDGNVDIQQPINPLVDDSYFQIGIIYEGNKIIDRLTRKLLPPLIKNVLTISPNGASEIDFLDVSSDRELDWKQQIMQIKLTYKTVTRLIDGKFEIQSQLKEKNIVGLWFRSDGDDSGGKFKVTVNNLRLE